MDLTRDYREFLQSLNANRVEYLLIGGWAVITYGYIRYTGDLDVWIGPGEENAARAVAAIEQFGFTDTGLTVDNFRNPRMLLVLGELPFRIEVLRTVSGVTFEECYPARVVKEIDGFEVPVIDLEHLKQNKLASGRHKDLDDLEHLP